MSEKVIGIIIDFEVSKTGNFVAITKESLVPVVSVAWLEKWCCEQRKIKMGDCILNQDKNGNICIHPKDNFAIVSIKDLLSAVRKQAKVMKK